ncbi:Neutral/alkaline nonlysosomal ceramidase [Fennellomyces sp. T-0311]|nr:Neutral/alkaline nonlysosomal ceramidase [Fennellomyces sp. T-0311]
MIIRYLLLLCALLNVALAQYRVGTGVADITGPVAEVMMMGYAEVGQTGKGLLQRIFARAFIVDQNDKRVVFVNTETQSMGDIIKQRVVKRLQSLYGNTIYTEQNVMISSTHSHSGNGGYLQHMLYEISALGYIEETNKPMVDGIVNAIVRAHDKLEAGGVVVHRGELLDTNLNRSPKAYLLNPEEERAQYKYDVDKDMTLLHFLNQNGNGLGMLSWFAVHGVSVNNTNRLINGDNKGYAAYAAEKHFNPGSLPGKGPFVAAFAQANEGDVTPNTLGAFCSGTETPCDGSKETKCPGTATCNGRGPGWTVSDLESNRIIGQNQANKAIELVSDPSSEIMKLDGPIDFRQKYWDITKAVIQRADGTSAKLCAPAMGYGFAAGTTDGPALSGFYQNTTKGNIFWDSISAIFQVSSPAQKECQSPKPILLDTGEAKFPYDWQPRIIDVQLLRVGNLYIAAVPSEMTTMSGRRLRNAIKSALVQSGIGNDDTIVIQSGPANGYASYCATYEEYQMQRYEGASTPYGPHTLEGYIQVFTELVESMAQGTPITNSETLPDFTDETFNLTPGYGADTAPLLKKFGDVLREVGSDTFNRVEKPIVSVRFVAGNPRNNVQLDGTFLTVEQKQSDGSWKTIRTDHDYDTKFHWEYTAKIIGRSQATIEWYLDESTETGTFRIGYFGHHKVALSGG